MAGIGERKQKKDYVIHVMLLTTKYISYVSAKIRHFEIGNDD